jgi:hypothetical protein
MHPLGQRVELDEIGELQAQAEPPSVDARRFGHRELVRRRPPQPGDRHQRETARARLVEQPGAHEAAVGHALRRDELAIEVGPASAEGGADRVDHGGELSVRAGARAAGAHHGRHVEEWHETVLDRVGRRGEPGQLTAVGGEDRHVRGHAAPRPLAGPDGGRTARTRWPPLCAIRGNTYRWRSRRAARSRARALPCAAASRVIASAPSQVRPDALLVPVAPAVALATDVERLNGRTPVGAADDAWLALGHTLFAAADLPVGQRAAVLCTGASQVEVLVLPGAAQAVRTVLSGAAVALRALAARLARHGTRSKREPG